MASWVQRAGGADATRDMFSYRCSDPPGHGRVCLQAANMAAPGAVVAHCAGIAGSPGFWPCSFFQRNQTLTSPPESNRINKPMTDPEAPRAGARTVKVPDDRDGQRLDNFLLGQLKGAPRSLVYKLVRSGQVRVNGGRAKAERKLEAGDEVRVPPLRVAEEGGKAAPPASFLARMEAAIVFEDARLLALNKPSGVASHGGSGISFGAIETLRALRPGQTLELVHRLDRDTSGLLIVAKKRSALTELQALMREGDSENGRGIAKRYLTLLVGRMPDGVMTVEAPLHIGLRQGGERHVQVHPEGKPSLSHFRVLERRGGHSYCEVRIETGRTHQIRVHAQHLGHPVAGDDKYGEEEINKRLRDQVGLRRLFLHAASLEFALDNGATPYVLNAPLAPELAEVLERLG